MYVLLLFTSIEGSRKRTTCGCSLIESQNQGEEKIGCCSIHTTALTEKLLNVRIKTKQLSSAERVAHAHLFHSAMHVCIGAHAAFTAIFSLNTQPIIICISSWRNQIVSTCKLRV